MFGTVEGTIRAELVRRDANKKFSYAEFKELHKAKAYGQKQQNQRIGFTELCFLQRQGEVR